MKPLGVTVDITPAMAGLMIHLLLLGESLPIDEARISEADRDSLESEGIINIRLENVSATEAPVLQTRVNLTFFGKRVAKEVCYAAYDTL